MKKSLVAIAVLGAFSGIASAQSAVTVYGTMDAGIVSERGGKDGSVTKLTSGVASASRLGFKGSEDLGGGLSANFVIESAVKVDTGETDSSGIFSRQAFVGLKSVSAGAVTLGRQYTPLYNTISQVADPFGAGYAGSAKNLLPTAGAETRTSNTIAYASPNFSGFSGEVAYSLGEVANSNSASRQFGAAVAYANGPLNVRLAYNNRNNDTLTVKTNDIGRNTLLAANYDFGVAKAFLAYGVDKGTNSAPLPNTANPYGAIIAPKASTDSSDLLLGVAVPFGASTILASYIRKDDKTGLNQDADQWALGYTYALSKRTSLYSSYARISNKNGAGYTVGNNTEAGTGDKAFNLGVKHTF
ncbi:porin [Herminiimonas sp. CN]|uniref:porin n=1 Tax=Herminiimonas sp. CN TaxID=1349818 RepID=UPI000473D89C|nr:porin [Herminiimonas sp. CN]